MPIDQTKRQSDTTMRRNLATGAARWRRIPGVLRGLLVFITFCSTAASGGDSPPPRRTLPRPHHIDAGTRAELAGRMTRHGATMSNLVRAVVLLDRPTVRLLAGRIADEEIVAETSGVTRARRRMILPDELLAEQSGLRTAAQQLAAAALQDGNDGELADRFAALARTCVSCHSVYVHGRPPPRHVETADGKK